MLTLLRPYWKHFVSIHVAQKRDKRRTYTDTLSGRFSPTQQARNPDDLFVIIRKVAHQEKPDQSASFQLNHRTSRFNLQIHIVELEASNPKQEEGEGFSETWVVPVICRLCFVELRCHH